MGVSVSRKVWLDGVDIGLIQEGKRVAIEAAELKKLPDCHIER